MSRIFRTKRAPNTHPKTFRRPRTHEASQASQPRDRIAPTDNKGRGRKPRFRPAARNMSKGRFSTCLWTFDGDDEVEMMKRIVHPNCVRLIEVYDGKSKYSIVMELADGGELFDRLVQRKHLSEREACGCFVQIMAAVEYLHGVGVVHRDIKPENIMFASPRDDAPLKLSDFGLGKLLGEGPEAANGGAALMKTFCGSPGYVGDRAEAAEPPRLPTLHSWPRSMWT
mmetsp:Transcript_76748/g.206835  ORF Transcript_76748/g.206835 Transcript_76748/m.206835 type:complete len:226 (-) Transcript_76748:1287-1964(-)